MNAEREMTLYPFKILIAVVGLILTFSLPADAQVPKSAAEAKA